MISITSILINLNCCDKSIIIIKFNNLLNLNLYVNSLNVLIIIDNDKLLKNVYKRDNIFNQSISLSRI